MFKPNRHNSVEHAAIMLVSLFTVRNDIQVKIGC